jgi:hypothetical protein
MALMPPFAELGSLWLAHRWDAGVKSSRHSACNTILSSLSGPGPASTTTTSMTR